MMPGGPAGAAQDGPAKSTHPPRTSALPLAHPGLGLNVLPQQPLLIKCVAGFACDGINGTFVDLLLDGAQQQEERLTYRFL